MALEESIAHEKRPPVSITITEVRNGFLVTPWGRNICEDVERNPWVFHTVTEIINQLPEIMSGSWRKQQ